MSEEKILELLRSTNIDDIKLGIILAYKELGKTWMINNFGYYYGQGDYKYASGFDYFNINIEVEESSIHFPDLIVAIAPTCLAVVNENYNYLGKIINYE